MHISKFIYFGNISHKTSNSDDEYLTKEIDPCIPPETFCSDGARTDSFIGDPLSRGESMSNVEPDDEENNISPNRKEYDIERSESALKHENDVQKYDHLTQAVPLGLDEFKSRAASPKIKSGTSPSESVIHRVDQGGAEYNYASESKEAKVLSSNKEAKDSNVPDPVEEIRQQPGRMPGDTVLKILMQKVQNLDINLSFLEQYMEVLNSRYVNIFKLYSKDIGEKDLLIRMIKEDIRSFLHQQEVMMKDVSELDSWKSHFSVQFDHIRRDNAILRNEVEKVLENQVSLEDKGVVVFLVCVIFSLIAILRLSLDMIISIYRVLSFNKTIHSRKFYQDSSSWFLLLLSCSIIIFILTS
ncbi:SUN domain-containing protein 4-like [Lotus japonicus]|uniref:SUN domain-containing protein 4-like n=2 Tax=Lotus japonicus TaxID=34305 RepID=UPI0025893FBC|nr:SUN domain-containing protein 4-like [Lotus japonicus]XP_057452781.1 SUN domain-containing protein 4-like [Lotus japonicus]